MSLGLSKDILSALGILSDGRGRPGGNSAWQYCQNSTARAGLPGMLGDHVRQTRSAHSPPVTAPTSHCPDCGAPQLGDLLLEESGHPEEEGKTESPQPGGTGVQHRRHWLDNIPVTWLLFLFPPPSDSSQVPPVCPHSLSITSCLLGLHLHLETAVLPDGVLWGHCCKKPTDLPFPAFQPHLVTWSTLTGPSSWVWGPTCPEGRDLSSSWHTR